MLLFTVINDIDAGEAVSKSWSIMKRIIARLSDPKLGKGLAMVANRLIPNYFCIFLSPYLSKTNYSSTKEMIVLIAFIIVLITIH